MANKKAALPGRAWRLLRMALLWARKGGVFRRGIFVDLRIVKSLKPGGHRSDRLHFGEREFSFEETPAFHFKTPSMRLLRIPCITPPAGFDNEDDDLVFARQDYRRSYLLDDETKRASEIDDCEEIDVDDDDSNAVPEGREYFEEAEEEDEIDRKAEQFIAEFYEQMKMQRQISLIQYNEMLLRGA